VIAERVRVVPLQAAEDVREGQLLEAGVGVHGASVDRPIPSESRGAITLPRPARRAGPAVVSTLRTWSWSPRPEVLRRLALTLGVLLALAVASSIVVVLSLQGRALPNTSVGGVPVGRMDRVELTRTLGPVAEERSGMRIVIITPTEQLVLGPETSLMLIDLDATIDATLAHGRLGRPRDLIAVARSFRVAEDIPFVVSLDEAAITAWVGALAETFDREESVGDLVIDARLLGVRAVGPHGERRIRQDELVAMALEALRTLSDAPIDLPFDASAPPAPRSAIEALADQVRASLRTPPVLIHDGRRLEVDAQHLASAVSVIDAVRDGVRGPQVHIRPEALPALLLRQARQTFEREAVDARIRTPQDAPLTLDERGDVTFRPVAADIRLEPGQSEVHVVPARLANQLTRMVAAGSSVATADLFEQPAPFSTEMARDGLPTHLIGTFTTYFTAGAARNLNIARLAATMDDVVVAPGDELSVNRTSGERRCADGYVPAGTIVRGELVDTCGGGVSQFGTTIYNAAFFAGLPIPQWQAHSFFISRYPMGREATLSYPELDVRFINETRGYIVVRTSTTPTSVTVSLYGIPRYAAVSATHSAPRAFTTFTTVERPTTALAPGARRVVQGGGGGFTVDVRRTWTPFDGEEAPPSERIVTVYRPQQRIIEFGVG
jgi:vancomycin resistance protein YoaR